MADEIHVRHVLCVDVCCLAALACSPRGRAWAACSLKIFTVPDEGRPYYGNYYKPKTVEKVHFSKNDKINFDVTSM